MPTCLPPSWLVPQRRWTASAFSLVELLVASSLLVIIVGMMVAMVHTTTALWNSTTGGVQDFQRARQAFDILTARISQATLNTYWDYRLDASGNPVEYIRQSDLRFLSGQAASLTGGGVASAPGKAVFFQAPGAVSGTGGMVMPGALSTWGYFVEYGSDRDYLPDFFAGRIAERYRFRLIEMAEPNNALSIYKYTSGVGKNQAYSDWTWFSDSLALPQRKRFIAENVVALVLLPKLSPAENVTAGQLLAPDYLYDSTRTISGGGALFDSKNQLPPLMEVNMVVVDEKDVARRSWTATPPDLGMADLFLDARRQTQDLDTLEQRLRNLGLHPRRFTVTVPIRGAKWSLNQKN